MGWNNVKKYYKIGHIVHVTDAGICIGSPYIHDIIVIGLDGTLKKRYEDRGNADLSTYQWKMVSDPDTLKRLIDDPDSFERDITVYTYKDGKILEAKCETPGWPNATHDGVLMHENMFSTDRSKVVIWARQDAELGLKWAREHLAQAEDKLDECRTRLAIAEGVFEKANALVRAQFP